LGASPDIGVLGPIFGDLWPINSPFNLKWTIYVPLVCKAEVPLHELLDAAALVEKGVPLPAELDRALLHGSSIGGARPKAMISSGSKKFVAKFSLQNDLYGVVKAEYIAMRLAADVGLTVAPVSLERAAGKDVLLINALIA
jgi:serine/threonine-protein kinase HipA